MQQIIVMAKHLFRIESTNVKSNCVIVPDAGDLKEFNRCFLSLELFRMNHQHEFFSGINVPAIELFDCSQIRLFAASNDHFFC